MAKKVICLDFDDTLGKFERYGLLRVMPFSALYAAAHLPEWRPGIYKFLMDLQIFYRDVAFVITTQAKRRYVLHCLSHFPEISRFFVKIYTRKLMTGEEGKNYYLVANDFGVDAGDLIAIGDSVYDRDNDNHFVSIRLKYETSIMAVKYLLVHLEEEFLIGYEKLPEKFYLGNRYFVWKDKRSKQIVIESLLDKMFKFPYV
ncbi:MAG: hypothetical protein ACFFD4_29895 [Candidatus Odinarchaeota archaeon]